MSITNKKLHTRANDIVDADAIVDEVNGLEDGTKVFSTINATNAVIGSIAKPNYSELTLINGYTGTALFRKEASGNGNLFLIVTVPDPVVSPIITAVPAIGFNSNAFISLAIVNASNGAAAQVYIGLDGALSFETTPVAGATYKGICLYAI